MKLRDRLIAIQEAKGLSNRQFAALLGTSHSTWCDTRNGKVRMHFEVVRGAVRAFRHEYPTLERDVLDFLERAEPVGKRKVRVTSNASSING